MMQDLARDWPLILAGALCLWLFLRWMVSTADPSAEGQARRDDWLKLEWWK